MNLPMQRTIGYLGALCLLPLGCGGKSNAADSHDPLEASSTCSKLCAAFKSVGCKGYSAEACASECLDQANIVPECSSKVLSLLDCRAGAISAERACKVYYLLSSDTSCQTEANAAGQCFLDATSDQDTDCTSHCKRTYRDVCPNATTLDICLKNCPLFVNTSNCSAELNALYRCWSLLPVEQVECNGGVSYGNNCETEASAYGACETAGS